MLSGCRVWLRGLGEQRRGKDAERKGDEDEQERNSKGKGKTRKEGFM